MPTPTYGRIPAALLRLSLAGALLLTAACATQLGSGGADTVNKRAPSVGAGLTAGRVAGR